jgi:hypothetical protein
MTFVPLVALVELLLMVKVPVDAALPDGKLTCVSQLSPGFRVTGTDPQSALIPVGNGVVTGCTKNGDEAVMLDIVRGWLPVL